MDEGEETEYEKLWSRINNWKFEQAEQYNPVLKTVEARTILKTLSDIWGDTGWARGGNMDLVISVAIGMMKLYEGIPRQTIMEETEIDTDCS